MFRSLISIVSGLIIGYLFASAVLYFNLHTVFIAGPILIAIAFIVVKVRRNSKFNKWLDEIKAAGYVDNG